MSSHIPNDASAKRSDSTLPASLPKTETPSQDDDYDYGPPEGGFQAWSTAIGASFVSFATFGMVNGFGAFVDFYKRDYLSNYSPTLISMIGSLQVFVMYILAGFAGALFDAIGPRILIPASGAVVVFSLFMLSITQPQRIWQQFLVQSILFNLGGAMSFFPALAIISHWFKLKAAIPFGIVAAGGSIGGLVYPIMIQRLLPRVGFGWTVRILAFVILFAYIVATLCIRQRRPTKPLPPLSQLLDLKAFTDPCYLFLALGSWFCVFAVFNPFFYLGLFGTVSYGASNLTPYFLAIMCAASIVGRVAPGFIAPHLGRFNVLAVTTLISAVLILAMWYNATSEGVSVAFAVMFGIFSGPFFSLVPACIAVISPVERVGARTGQVFGFMSFGALAGTPIGGIFIREQTVENFRHLIIFSGCMGLLGAFFLTVARFCRDKRLFVVV